MQLMRHRDRLRRPVTVLTQDQVGLSPAWVVALEGIGPVQQDDHVSILFKAVVN